MIKRWRFFFLFCLFLLRACVRARVCVCVCVCVIEGVRKIRHILTFFAKADTRDTAKPPLSSTKHCREHRGNPPPSRAHFVLSRPYPHGQWYLHFRTLYTNPPPPYPLKPKKKKKKKKTRKKNNNKKKNRFKF